MAKKNSEPNLLDLLKVVNDLTTKISALETVIIKQTAIIEIQAEDIKVIRSAVEGKKNVHFTNDNNAQSPASVPVTQRPVRQTRKTTAAAIAAAGNTSKTQTTGTQNTVVKPRLSLLTTRIMTPETAQPGNIIHTKDKKDKIESTLPTCAATKSATDFNTESSWQKVARKSKRKIVSGTAEEDNELKTVERLKYLQAWQFKPDTTVQNVRNYLNKIVECKDYFVEKRQIKSDWHAVFIIGVPESIYDRMSSPTSWPAGVRVSHWIFRSRARAALSGAQQ